MGAASPRVSEYRIPIEESQAQIVKKLTELKDLIEKGDLKPWESAGLKAIWFRQHLYQRLLYLDQNVVEIRPKCFCYNDALRRDGYFS